MSEKLKFSVSSVVNITENVVALHFKEQSAKATRFSVQGFFKRRYAELTGEPMDFVPTANQE